jgi:hypothetical protein
MAAFGLHAGNLVRNLAALIWTLWWLFPLDLAAMVIVYCRYLNPQATIACLGKI